MDVLLLGADYYGTLAAARAYGRAGVRVVMADAHKRARALFSRYVSQKLVHPPLSRPADLIAWLLEYGRAHPGTLLYPPNDSLAWLFALHREELGEHFAMLSPREEVIFSLLDKKRLHAACAAVGLEVPTTLDAADFANASAATLPFPVLVKPRTQIYLTSGIKGFIAHDRRELAGQIRRFADLVSFDATLTSKHPDVVEPMLQEYHAAAETSIFSISGFVSSSGEIVARGALKVLQRPRKVGIGLCFEGREVEPALVNKLAALCRNVGYTGAFECELIVQGDRRLLIDFNPRFYSQMGFDIARGLPLPQLVLHAANGDAGDVNALMDKARAWTSSGGEVYCHKTILDLVLRLQGFSGQMTPEEVRRWRAWYAKHRRTATDAVRDAEDKMPAVVDTARWVRHFARHPRHFVRSFVLNR